MNEQINLLANKINQLIAVNKQLVDEQFVLQIEFDALYKILLSKGFITEGEFIAQRDVGFKKLQKHIERLEHYKANDYDLGRFKDDLKKENKK